MDGPSPKEISTALADVDRLLANIRQDLSRMPDHKRGTRWHSDRTRERSRLVAQREFLVARKAEMALLN